MKITIVENEYEIEYYRQFTSSLLSLIDSAVLQVFKRNKPYDLKFFFIGSKCYVCITIQTSLNNLAVLIRGHCRTYIHRQLKIKYNIDTEFSNICNITDNIITTYSCFDFNDVPGYHNLTEIRLIKIKE